MTDFSATLVGETLVLATDDITAATVALMALQACDRTVWITGEERVDVLQGFELEMDEIDELAGDDAGQEDYDRVFQTDYVRYSGAIYLLSDFSASWGISGGVGLPEWMRGWHAYLSDSFFSGLVLRYNKYDDDDREPDFTGESGVTVAGFII